MDTAKVIDVVFNANASYIQHFCVAITSLLENNLRHVRRIFFISDKIEGKIVERTCSFIQSRYGKKVICLKFKNPVVKEFKTKASVPEVAYYRLFLSEMLPSDVDKVLYLDPDIVVNGDISTLLELDFKINRKACKGSKETEADEGLSTEEFYLYGVSEMQWQDSGRLHNLGITSSNYFNAGVLLINLKKWRSENITAFLIAIALNKKESLEYYDQDVLNIAFQDHWGELSNRFNTVNLSLVQEKVYKKDYTIIHYTGETKPWHLKSRHPLKTIYWYYLWKTPYKYYIPPELTINRILKKVLKISSLFSKREFAKI